MKKQLLTTISFLLMVFGVSSIQAQTTVTSYAEDFTNTVDMALWNPNTATHPDGTPAFDVTQEDGALKVKLQQVNFWDGQFYDLTQHENIIIDMTASPIISFDFMIETGATFDSVAVDSVDVLVSVFGPDTSGTLKREVLAVKKKLPADGTMYHYVFDIGSNLGELEWNGDVLENDLSEVQAVLIESVTYPGKYKYNYTMDNFKIGDAAAPPSLVTSYSENFDAPIDLALWRPNLGEHPDGTPAFDVTQENGALNVKLQQVNFWDGQFYNFTKNENIIIDMVANPYVSFDFVIATGATFDSVAVDSVDVLVSVFGPDTSGTLKREVLAVKKKLPADGLLHHYVFDIGSNLGELEWNGDVLENDLTEVQAVLIESVTYPGKYKYSYTMDNFKVGDAAAPPSLVTGYSENFDEPVDLALWRPNLGEHPDGTPAFDVTQENGALNVKLQQVNFWDGQFYNLTKNENIIIDMTANPLVSFDFMIETGATFDSVAVDSVDVLVSVFGPDTSGTLKREVLAVKKKLPADGLMHNYVFDIGSNLGELEWNGDVLENDLSEVQAILIESVTYPGKYKYSYIMDNFKVGSATGPTVVTSYSENFDAPVDLALWRPNLGEHPDGTPAFDVTQENGALNVKLQQVNFWDGQFYNLTKYEDIIIDMVDNPYVSFDFVIATGATFDSVAVDSVDVLVSVFGPDTSGTLKREVLAVKKKLPADGLLHHYVFDIGSNLGELEWNGDVLENDLTEVQAILIESVTYPGKYKYSYTMDNFEVGAAAAPPKVVTGYTEDFDSPVDLALWRPNLGEHPDGTPAFGVTQANDALNVALNQVNFWDGQFYNLTRYENIIIDMTENPLVSFDFMIETGATFDSVAVDSVDVLVSVFGPDSTGTLKREVLAVKKKLPADGLMHNYVFDIGSNLGELEWNGDVLENDLTEVQAVLIESVTYPGKYHYNYIMDNFKVGYDALVVDPLLSYQVPPVNNKFWAQWKVSPTHAPMNGATGLSMGEVEAWGDFGAIVRFNSDGFIDAYNGTTYEAANELAYEKDGIYTIEIIGDVTKSTYTVKVKPKGLDWVEIGTDFVFRSSTPQTTINYFNMKIEENTTWGGVPGARLRPSFEKGEYILGFYNENGADLAMSTIHTVDFNATPTADGLNTAFALSKDEAGLLAWGELSTIIRFNDQNKIDVRNGGAYEAVEDLTYVAGTEYQVSMVVDVPNNKYSVAVASDGGDPVVIATDYAFRAEADQLNYAIKQNLIGGDFGGAEGDLLINNLEIAFVGVDDIDLPNFSFYPNPTIDMLVVKTGEFASQIKITNIAGIVLKSINTNTNSTESINISELSAGTYILSVYSENGHSSKLFVKK